MKPLIVGEAPSKNEDPELPCEGRVGQRLAACAGLSYDAYLARFERTNLLRYRQDTATKGFEFDAKAARDEARLLLKALAPQQQVILLGKRVARAFDIDDFEYFEPLPLGEASVAWVVPHPSGVNRWWNDATNAAKMNGFMRYFVKQYSR